VRRKARKEEESTVQPFSFTIEGRKKGGKTYSVLYRQKGKEKGKPIIKKGGKIEAISCTTLPRE